MSIGTAVGAACRELHTNMFSYWKKHTAKTYNISITNVLVYLFSIPIVESVNCGCLRDDVPRL